MSEAQLEQAMGRPSRIHVSNQGQGRREQRIFERNGRTYHVSTHEGRVTAIRNRAGTAAGSKPRPCPSPQDIRNLETSASSITLVAAERRQLRDQLQRLRECR